MFFNLHSVQLLSSIEFHSDRSAQKLEDTSLRAREQPTTLLIDLDACDLSLLAPKVEREGNDLLPKWQLFLTGKTIALSVMGINTMDFDVTVLVAGDEAVSCWT